MSESPIRGEVPERVPSSLRCEASRKGFRCSLRAGHIGGHQAYFAHQSPDPPRPTVAEIVLAYKQLRKQPEPRQASQRLTNPNRRSHHLSAPGEWISKGHLLVPFPDEDDAWSLDWSEHGSPPALAIEDMLPWERRAFRES